MLNQHAVTSERIWREKCSAIPIHFFVGKSRWSSNFPLLVSQLRSIPRAMFLEECESCIQQMHLIYGLSTLSSIFDTDSGPFYLSSGVKVWMQPAQGLLVPSYPPMEGRWKSCPPQLSVDCVFNPVNSQELPMHRLIPDTSSLESWGCS